MFGSGTEEVWGAYPLCPPWHKEKESIKKGRCIQRFGATIAYVSAYPETKGLNPKGGPNFVFKHTQEFLFPTTSKP
jgi:glutamate-1-semialdehyde 2,1-aminomutase